MPKNMHMQIKIQKYARILTVLFSGHRGTGRVDAYNRRSAADCHHDTSSPASRVCASDLSAHRAACTSQSCMIVWYGIVEFNVPLDTL